MFIEEDKIKINMNRLTPLFILLLICGFTENALSQWVQTRGPGAGVTTSMHTLGNNIFAGNLDWGRSDGRVYKSTDLGTEWYAADNGITGKIYIFDFDNVGNTVFAANGPTGVHRTQDFGNTWVNVNGGMLGTNFSLLAKDNMIFVGREGTGVYVSTNLGDTWMPRNNGLPSVAIVYEMEKLGNFIFAGLEGGGGPAPLFRSSDNGLSWHIMNNGLPLGSNVHEFAVNGTTLFTSIIGDFAQNEYGVYRSTNNGESWTAVNNGIPPVVGGNSGEIFVHDGIIYLATTYPSGVRLYKSTNNGDNWIPATTGINNQMAQSFTAAGSYVFAGLGLYSSVFRTSNQGASWEPARNGLANSNSQKLLEHNGRLYSGSFEGLFYTTDGGNRWTEMENGLRFGLPITDLEANGSNIYITTDQYGVFISPDNGASWSEKNSGITGTFAKSIESIHLKDNALYVGTWDGIFKSTNNGDNWTAVNTGIPTEFGGSIVKVNVINSLNGNLYAGTVLEKIYKSTNNGASWFPSSSGITTYGSTIHDILAKGNVLYAATEGGIYKSTDEGASWSLITPEGIVRKIIAAGEKLIASSYGYTVLTGFNLLISSDQGATWNTFNTGMNPGSRVQTLLVSGNTLYGGTDTRSVWKRDISSLLAVGNENETVTDYRLAQNYPNPFNPSTVINFSIPARGFTTLKVFDITGREITSLVNSDINAGNHSVTFNAEGLTTGVYFYTLTSGDFKETKRMLLVK